MEVLEEGSTVVERASEPFGQLGPGDDQDCSFKVRIGVSLAFLWLTNRTVSRQYDVDHLMPRKRRITK